MPGHEQEMVYVGLFLDKYLEGLIKKDLLKEEQERQEVEAVSENKECVRSSLP